MTTGDRIKNLRKQHGISAEILASALGVSRATMFRYENGEIEKLPGSILEPLSKALHTTPAYLMGWEEEKAKEDVVNYPEKHIDGIMPLDIKGMKRIPILGRIAAGMPIDATENIEGYTYTELNGDADYFALRVKGDSMNAARINDGDIVICRKQEVAQDGEIAVVLIGMEDATLKRFYRTNSTVTLMPNSTNPTHKPQIYNLQETKIDILGKVVKVEFML